jgi:hypothetical protein
LGVTEDTRFLAGGRLAFIKLMKALAYVGHDVLIVSSTGATQKVVDPQPASIIRLRMTHYRIIGPLVFLARLLHHLPPLISKADVVVVNSGYTVYPVTLLAKIMSRKVVVLQHDAHNLDYLQTLASTPSRRYTAILRWILSYTPLRMVDGVLCISDNTVRGLRSMGFKTKAFTVGNVVE